MTRPTRWLPVLLGLLVASCRSTDPACAGRNAADLAPSAARFRAMSPDERREDARLFNALAQRCGWEP